MVSFYLFEAEVPEPARVSLLNILCFVNSFQKMFPSALSVLGSPGPDGRGQGSNLHENLPWTGGDVGAKFHPDRCRGLDFQWPSTYQQRDKHLYAHFYTMIIFRKFANTSSPYHVCLMQVFQLQTTNYKLIEQP